MIENSKEPEKKKIKEEDLGTVSGGCGKKPDPHDDIRFATKMKCSECGRIDCWKGDWWDEKDYPCPRCGKLSFRGHAYQYRPIDV